MRKMTGNRRWLLSLMLLCFTLLAAACGAHSNDTPNGEEPGTDDPPVDIAEPLPEVDLEPYRFFDDGSRSVTVSYVFPNEDMQPDPERSGEAVYDLKNTQEETEGPKLRFLPENLAGLPDFSQPVTDAADRAFLLGEVEKLAPPANGVMPEVSSNPIYLYVDDIYYAFYHTGEILGDGVCGTCSDFCRVSALSYKYLAADAGRWELSSSLLALPDGEVPDRPVPTEENYKMLVLGEHYRKELNLSQAQEFLKQLFFKRGAVIGNKTPWDWQQPEENGICLVETLEGLENRVWLYPDTVYFQRSIDSEGPWADSSMLYGQSDWDRYATSWQRVYEAYGDYSWEKLETLLEP